MSGQPIGKLTVEVDMDKAKFDQGINAIKNSLSTHRGQYKSLTRASRNQNMEWNKGTAALYAMRGAYQDLTNQVGYYQNRMTELEASGKKGSTQWTKYNNIVTKAQAQMAELSSEYDQFGLALHVQNQRLTQAGTVFTNFGRGLRATGETIGHMGDVFTRVGAAATAGGALFIKSAMDYEQGMVAIRKTTDMGHKELNELSNSLKNMGQTMPVAIEQIQDVAAIAGQLGVRGVGDITKFTEVMVKLGTATNLSASEAAEAIARFTNITGTGTANIERIGSSLVALGNNFATTEAEIMTLVTRLAGTLSSLGVAEADIIGLAGAMSSLGISAEMGGTAISTFFVNMSQVVSAGEEELESFAKVANMSSQEFKNLFNTDAMGAFEALIKGMSDIRKEGGDLVATMGELGIGNARMRDSITRLVQGYDTLQDTMSLSNQAFSESTALQREYETMLESTAAQWEILKNNAKLFAISIGESLLPAVNELFSETGGLKDMATGLAEAFSNLDLDTRKNIVTFGALSLVLGPVLSTAGSLITVIGGISSALGTVLTTLGAIKGAFAFYKFGTITASLSEAGTVTLALGKAIAALSSPIGLATTAALAAGAAYVYFTRESRNAAAASRDLGVELNALEAESVNNYVDSLSNLQAIMATGVIGDGSALKESVGSLADEIERLGELKIKELQEDLKNFDPRLNMHEPIQAQINAIEKQVDKAQALSQMIDEIYQRAEEQNRALTDVEISSIGRLTEAMTVSYSEILGDTPEQAAIIFQRLADNIETMSDEMLSGRIDAIKEWQRLEKEGHQAQLNNLKDAHRRGVIEEQGYHERVETQQKIHNDNMFNIQRAHVHALHEQNKRWIENSKYYKNKSDEDKSKLAIHETAKQLGLEMDEVRKYLESEVRRSAEYIQGQIDYASQNLSGAASVVAEKWNQAVQSMGKPLSELTDGEMEDFIQKTKELGLTWDDIELLKKEAEIDDNTLEFLNRVQMANFEWHSATLEQKQAFLEVVGIDDVETILTKMGIWNDLTVEEQEAILKAVESGESTLSDILLQLGEWENLTLGEKLAIVTAETGDLRTAIDELKDFNNITPEVKDAIIKAIIENEFSLEQFVMMWQDTEFQEKLARVDVQSEEAMNSITSLVVAWLEQVLNLNDKTLRANDEATPVINEADERAKQFGETDAENTISTNDQSSDVVSQAGENVDDFGAKKPDVPLASHDVNIANNTRDLGQKVDNLGDKRPNVPLEATDNATWKINGVSDSLWALDGSTANTYIYTHYRSTYGVSRLKKGTRQHKGGPAILGDGGRREPYLTPQGAFGISPSVDTLYHLPRGTKVWPSISKFRTEAQTSKTLSQYLDRLPRYAKGTDLSFLDDLRTIRLPESITNPPKQETSQAINVSFNLHVVGDSISRSQADKIIEPIANALDRYGKKTGRRVVV